MRAFARKLYVCFALLAMAYTATASTSSGREALVTSMDTVQCSASSVMAALSGMPATQKACSEYVLESPTVLYRVRPHKNEALLPVGEVVWIRFSKNHLQVRVDDSQQDYEFDVVSMELTNRPARSEMEKQSALNSAAGHRSEHLRRLVNDKNER